jgi:hypothetical protein
LSSKGIVLSATIATLLIVGIGYSITVNKGFPNRLPPILRSDLAEEPWHFNKNDEGEFCFGMYGKNDFCSFGDSKSSKDLYVVGDSNMSSISKSIVDKALSSGFRTTLMSSSACYFAPNSFSAKSDGSPREISTEPCGVEYQQRRLSKLNSTSSDSNILVIGGMLDVYLKGKELGFRSANDMSIEKNIVEGIQELADSGSKIVLVYPYPIAKQHIGSYALRKLKEVEYSLDLNSLKHLIQIASNEVAISNEEFYRMLVMRLIY